MNDPRLTILNALDKQKFRVSLSPHIVFVCGGKFDIKETKKQISIRNLFMNSSGKVANINFVMAEYYDDWQNAYASLSEFQNDISSLSSKIVVIPETASSLAELGIFYENPRTRKILTIILHTKYYKENSFIKNGILTPLEAINEDSVLVYNLNHHRIEQVKKQEVESALDDIVEQCGKLKATKKYSDDHRGHNLLLVFQVIDLFAALTITEIVSYLKLLGLPFNKKEMKTILYVLTQFKFIGGEKRGNQFFYYSHTQEMNRVLFQSKDNQPQFEYNSSKIEVIQYYTNKAKLDRNFSKRLTVFQNNGDNLHASI